jgi:hypothetical protein
MGQWEQLAKPKLKSIVLFYGKGPGGPGELGGPVGGLEEKFVGEIYTPQGTC